MLGRFACCLAAIIAWLAAASETRAQVDFKGKQISMVVSSAVGGGTDATARLIAPFFERYLPGNPVIVIRNMPGAGGVTALNFVVQQTKPDGLTLIGGANAQLSPVTYKKSNGLYDPRNFRYIGGLGRGGTIVIANREHE